MIFGKTISYWIETSGGMILGSICGFFIFKSKPNINVWIEFIKEFPNVGMCAFGFLLTFLSIILQGDSDMILWMKSRKILFERFVSFNKRVVFLSLFLTFYSYFLTYLNREIIKKTIFIDLGFFDAVSIAIFGFCFIWFLIDVVTFILIFYNLIQKN